jgi:hypothetical protein
MKDVQEQFKPDDDNDNQFERPKSALRFARYLLLLIMVTMALLFIFTNKDKINMDNFRRLLAKIDIGISLGSEIDDTQIDFEYRENSVTRVYKDGIARLTGERLSIMDNRGTQFLNVLSGFEQPQLIANNKYVLAYDSGGTELIVTNSFAVLFEKTFSDKIINASMNDSGYFAVVTQSDGYKSSVYVFNSKFEEIFKWDSLSRYIVDVEVAHNNDAIAVSTLYSEGEAIMPQINYFEFSDENITWSVDFDETVSPAISCKSDGTICAIFEWGVCFIDNKGREKSRYQFEQNLVQNFDIDDEKYNAFVLSHSVSGNSTLVVLDNNGIMISSTEIDEYIKSVDVMGDKVALLSTNNVMALNILSGKISWQRENSSNGVDVFFSDKSSVLVVSEISAVYNIIN